MSDLTNEERTELRQILEKHFDLGELRTLAFDMGINYQNFPNVLHEFAREFFLYFERQNRLSYLVSEIIKRRPNLELVQILTKLPPSKPNVKMQIILPDSDLQKANELIENIAQQLGYSSKEVQIIGAAWGSLMVLIGLPEEISQVLIEEKKEQQKFVNKILNYFVTTQVVAS